MPDDPRSLVLGKVTDVEISDKGLRARLQRLNGPSGVITDWIPVASPMAGPEVGVLFAPEVDDIAVMAFAAGCPIILGFITGGESGAVTKETTERTIASRDKNMIILIDGDKCGITLRDKNDNEIVMDKDGIKIKSAGKITIEASGTAAVKGSSVELN